MNGVDLARFEFDYDTTWHAFFLDRELNIYSRYGGRDEESADGRQSKESLLTTMREVLDVHQRRQARAAAEGEKPATEQESKESAADFHPLPGKRSAPEDMALLKRSHQGCVHCHQVKEYRILQDFHDGKFSRTELFVFPLPENVGIRFDRAHGHRIQEVIPTSPAAKANLAPGDIVTRVNDVPVHSEQDVRWALHRAGDVDQISVSIVRSGDGAGQTDTTPSQTIHCQLKLSPQWRETELGWRKSLRSVPLPLGFLAYALGREERREAKFTEGRLAIKVVSLRGPGLAVNLGLEKGDLITALETNDADRSFEDFKSDLLRRYRPGDTVRVTVLRNGKPVPLEGRFPDWHSSETSVP